MDSLIALVKIEGNFLFDKASPSEFRSALVNVLGQDKGQVVGGTCTEMRRTTHTSFPSFSRYLSLISYQRVVAVRRCFGYW